MPRCCDYGICQQPGVVVATYTAERLEKKNKFACSQQHQLNLGREIQAQGWAPDWKVLPGNTVPAVPPKPVEEP